jgi:hypothetical protein
MSSAPFPANEGSEPHDSTPATGLRLKDAEKIAADRLEGSGGSLQEALAGVVANSPRDEIESLTDRIGAAQSAYVGPSETTKLPFPGEAARAGAAGGSTEQALLGLREWGEARATVAAELADIQSQPLFLQSEQQQLGGGTHWQPVKEDAEPYHPAEHERAQPTALEPAPTGEPPRAEPPLPQTRPPEPPRPQSLNARLQAPLPEEPPAEEPLAEPPRPEPPRPQALGEATVTPIATALDAAAKLAADADAAAAALQNLTRMLQAHQRPASMIPSPMQQAALRPTEPRPPESEPRFVPTPPRSISPSDPLQMATPPRPEQRPIQRMMPRPAPQYPAARPIRPPTLRPTPAPRDTRQFDLRGFLAGFALSCAIGALVYMYLMAG